MKKTFLVFALAGILLACKKETSTPNSNTNNTTDSTSNTTNNTNNNTSSSAVVSSIDCSSAVITGTLKVNELVNSVTVKINYTGGNGKAYSSQSINSTGVLGLTAKISSGTLSSGNGSLTYSVSGTPKSVGDAIFQISIGGQKCSVNINVDDVNQVSIKAGENITDIDGNSYKTVIIGTQRWMAENLKTTKFNDGTPIPLAIDPSSWLNAKAPARCYYDNNTSNAKYGSLYNWSVIGIYDINSKNVCPAGWHVSRDIDWQDLANYLGGEEVAGGKLKEAGFVNWVSPNTDASNIALFNALPGGLRTSNGNFYWINNKGYWWTATEQSGAESIYRILKFDSSTLDWSFDSRSYGMSIRCVKD